MKWPRLYGDCTKNPQVRRSCGFWRLQSKPPQRTRTGPGINSYFIGHQFKVTQSDSLGCRGRSGGPCNEIHAASPYLKPALTSWIHSSSTLTHTSHLPLRHHMEGVCVCVCVCFFPTNGKQLGVKEWQQIFHQVVLVLSPRRKAEFLKEKCAIYLLYES